MKQAGSRSRTLDLLARGPARYRLCRKCNARATVDSRAYKPRAVTMYIYIFRYDPGFIYIYIYLYIYRYIYYTHSLLMVGEKSDHTCPPRG